MTVEVAEAANSLWLNADRPRTRLWCERQRASAGAGAVASQCLTCRLESDRESQSEPVSLRHEAYLEAVERDFNPAVAFDL